MSIAIPAIIILTILGIGLFVSFIFRRVVATNEVHIVQSGKITKSYGKDTENGNVYYEWPSFLPVIGISKIVLPVSVFDLTLNSYAAYDVGRVPFVVDIQAFFRITDSNLAASRISGISELQDQLIGMLQGAARAMLASAEIEEILQGRSKFGEEFTSAVQEQLKHWGVETVKNIELMDIRDANGSSVIANIMAKKQSLIEMQSRVEVANNNRTAEIAEVEAVRDADMKKVEANQTVDTRIAQKTQAVGVANEQAQQEIQEQARITKEKEMAVVRVQDVQRQAITKEQGIIKAEEDKQKVILDAEAKRDAELRKAEGIAAVGKAEAEAEELMQLAPVKAQIALVEKISGDEQYQKYLLGVEQIKANQAVGIEQAKAYHGADLKIIANTGNASEGLSSFGQLFTPTGGLNIGGALEALSNTDAGKALVEKIVTPKN